MPENSVDLFGVFWIYLIVFILLCPVSPCLLVSLRMAGHNFMNITFVAQILTSLLFVHRFVFCRLAHFYALSLSLHFMFHIYQKLSLRSLLIFDILGAIVMSSAS